MRWISISEAQAQIMERQSPKPDNLIQAYQHTWKLIERRLVDGQLVARPSRSGGAYGCVLRCEEGRPICPLSSDGTIPSDFWIHYCDARDNVPALITIPTLTEASQIGDDFAFTLASGVIDNGTIEGWARGVDVHLEGLRGLLSISGRTPGTRIDDSAVVELTLQAIRDGKSPTDAVLEFFAMLGGNSTDDARKKRLRARLTEHGITFARGRKKAPI